MLVYRVFAYAAGSPAGTSGHPDYVHLPAQGLFRLDNPAAYVTWYYGLTPEVAIGESFGDHGRWSDAMFQTPWLPAGERVLGVFEIPDDLAVLDVDDAQNLLDRSLRPTQVVTRNRSVTQGWVLKVFEEMKPGGARKWDGVRWWSYHRPHWTVIGLWTAEATPPPHRLVKVEKLSAAHPAVESARETLKKIWH